MNHSTVLPFLVVVLVAAATAAEPQNFAGEYSDKKFLNNQAVFQMSLEQAGNAVSVWFSAGYSDGHGPSPEAQGTGKVTAKGTLGFTFSDSHKNAGTGTITRAGDAIIVSLKTTRVGDSQCLEFYKQASDWVGWGKNRRDVGGGSFRALVRSKLVGRDSVEPPSSLPPRQNI